MNEVIQKERIFHHMVYIPQTGWNHKRGDRLNSDGSMFIKYITLSLYNEDGFRFYHEVLR